jgi:hypothetical protein
MSPLSGTPVVIIPIASALFFANHLLTRATHVIYRTASPSPTKNPYDIELPRRFRDAGHEHPEGSDQPAAEYHRPRIEPVDQPAREYESGGLYQGPEREERRARGAGEPEVFVKVWKKHSERIEEEAVQDDYKK